MNAVDEARLDLVFGALAHPVRRAILDHVNDGGGTVVELARPHRMSLNAISKHIKKLEAAGLIEREVHGNFHRISMNKERMKDALRWMTHYVPFWHENLQGLKTALEGEQ